MVKLPKIINSSYGYFLADFLIEEETVVFG